MEKGNTWNCLNIEVQPRRFTYQEHVTRIGATCNSWKINNEISTEESNFSLGHYALVTS